MSSPCYDELVRLGERDVGDPGMLYAYRHWAWFGKPPTGWSAKVERDAQTQNVRHILEKPDGGPGGGSATIFGPYMTVDFTLDWGSETALHRREPFEGWNDARSRGLLLLCNT